MPCKSVRRWRLLGKLQSQSKSCLHELFDVKLPRALSRAEREPGATQIQGNLPGLLERLLSVHTAGEKGLVTSSSK